MTRLVTIMDMRIIVTGDRFWACHTLAANILRRLVERYGGMATIRDKLGHSISKHRLDMDLRKPARP